MEMKRTRDQRMERPICLNMNSTGLALQENEGQ